MANQEHVDRLLQGVEAWNQWRKENPKIKPDLSYADLRSAKLSTANLNSADLRVANLFSADLSYAGLSAANLSSAYLNSASLSSAYLEFASLSAANLRFANLSSANLSSADLSSADLSATDLSAVQALQANFQAATLTGACIEDWNINSNTNLQEVVCEYIFTKHDWRQFTDRRPHDPNQIFAPGEFTKRYQIVLETVDLFFNDGIDWKAFLASLNDLQTEYGDEVNIQGIEKKAGGTFLVRLEVPPDTDKGTIEQQVKASYEVNLKQLEAQYHAELQTLKIQHSDEIITLYRQHSADLKEITMSYANKPITVEAKAVAENQSSSESYTNHFNHATIANFANKMQDQASMQTNQYMART